MRIKFKKEWLDWEEFLLITIFGIEVISLRMVLDWNDCFFTPTFGITLFNFTILFLKEPKNENR